MPYNSHSKSVTVICCAFLFLLSLSCSGLKLILPEEKNQFFNFDPETRVLTNSPALSDEHKPILLVLYALPNGNTIETTFGKKISLKDDWQYDIQHIAAQTRFLRATMKEYSIVVAYLEAKQKSWPSWRIKHSSDDIARIIDYVRFETGNPESVILSAHSGGGSFISGFINAFDSIPNYIKRIAYLDANYSYEDSVGQGEKLIHWLQADTNHRLAVIAYDDREIMLNGKKVISPTGGTYRATKRMIQYFVEQTDITTKQDSTIQQYFAFSGRAQFIIHTNPDTLILHTVLVERNGFIHSMLFGAPYEEKQYSFFGARAYSQFIEAEIPWQKQLH